jgi:transposase InsO family protein
VSLERVSHRICWIRILRQPVDWEKWTGDITAVWTYEGWLYLAVVLDLYSRRVVGWAMAATQDETLIETAFRMALLGRHPPTGLLFHSDRGSQYTSDAYQALLADVSVTVSMSRTGNCYDNAVTESFFGTRDRANASNALLSRHEGRPGKLSSSRWSASTTGFGDIPRWAM